MVNCIGCKRAFRTGLGKSKETRCENCAKIWREIREKEDEDARVERKREMDLRERELEIKQRQLDLERQKVTIRETLPMGGLVELTCYYDEKMQDKVASLLQGAHLAISPGTPIETTPRSSKESRGTTEFKKTRKLPLVEGLKSRITSRHKLEDEGSSFGSGASVD